MIRGRGGWARKIHADAYQGAGIPDVIACIQGRFIAFETKKSQCIPTRIQRATMAEISRSGGVACPVWTVEDAEEIIDEILEGVA